MRYCAYCGLAESALTDRPARECDDCRDGVKHTHFATCPDHGEHDFVFPRPWVDDGIRDPF